MKAIDENVLERVAGSLLGLAIGDALGAHVEFRPRDYLLSNPVTDLSSGGTWGLEKGQFTDDTSMALSLAISLIVCEKFNLYDQLVRYKWWFRHGYMSSTGQCFDIGNATRQSIERFEQRQCVFVKTNHISSEEMDFHTDNPRLRSFDVYCSQTGVAGNGALMRLAPVPLFFFRDPPTAVEYAGLSGIITHGDIKAYDACRYYAALIVAALRGDDKASLLNEKFYEKYRAWFGNRDLHPDILAIARGSYKRRGGYDEGIRGSGYIVKALQAALWAFWSAETFKDGALAAVNLGDDTDTTAAIYGQLAGAYYRLNNLPGEWLQHVYAKEFILTLAKWISTEGEQFLPKMVDYPIEPPVEHHDKLSSEDQFHIHIQRSS